MGKFFTVKVKRKKTGEIKEIKIDKTILITGIVIVFVLILLIVIIISSIKPVKIELKEFIEIEIGDKIPSKSDFIIDGYNYDVDNIYFDFSNVNINKVGEYEIKVNANNNGEDTTILKVIDETSPELVLKDLYISKGHNYSLNDFIKSCSDNSKENCNINFLDSFNEDGTKIDYLSFTDEGTYIIKIKASDNNGNSIIRSSKLIIGSGKTKAVLCKYGNTIYDNSYTLSYPVYNETYNCPLKTSMQDNETIYNDALGYFNRIYNTYKKKLKIYLKENNIAYNKISVVTEFISVPNNTNSGFLGYQINAVVNVDENTVSSFTISKDETLIYSNNLYNIK